MAYKRSEFQPVLPDITDDSMKEVDVDVEMINRKDVLRGKKKSGSEGKANVNPIDTDSVKNDHKKNSMGTPEGKSNNSLGRKIVIGILIVVIVVLVILLIYQIHKYYTTNDIPSTSGDRSEISIPPKNDNKIHPAPSKRPGLYLEGTDVKPSSQSSGCIPQSVRDLDNDVLSQYIKKGGNADNQRQKIDVKEQMRARNVEHNSMIHDTQKEELNTNDDMARISKIIDEAREAEETYMDNEDIPTREDMIQQIQKDMYRDQQRTVTLESIEEDNDNIINNFLQEGNDEDDNTSVKSEDGGCQFALTKGKNTGQICGRKRLTETRCHRHKNK